MKKASLSSDEDESPHSTQKSNSIGFCKEHKERLRLICLEDNQKICDDCIHFGKHKGHRIKLINVMLKENNTQLMKLRTIIDSLEDHSENIQLLLENKRLTIIDNVEAKFKEIRKILNLKESQLLKEIKIFFEAQKNITGQGLGLESKLRKDLLRKVKEREDFIDREDFFQIMQEDLSIILSKFDDTSIYKVYDSISQGLGLQSESFNETLSKEIEAIAAMSFPFKDVVEGTLVDLLGDYGKKLNILEFESHFDIKISKNNIAEIFVLNETKITELADDKWNKVGKIILRLEKYKELVKRDLAILPNIMTKARNLTLVEITFKPKGLSDSLFSSIIQGLSLEKLENLKGFHVDLSNCKIGDNSVILLSDGISRKLANIKSLALVLNSTQTTNQALGLLGKKVLASMKNLESLGLWFENTLLSDEEAIRILKGLKNLKQISLNLKNTQITDKTVEFLANDVLSNLSSSLDLFYLELDGTKITDSSVKQLLEKMKNCKEFYLSPKNNTWVV